MLVLTMTAPNWLPPAIPAALGLLGAIAVAVDAASGRDGGTADRVAGLLCGIVLAGGGAWMIWAWTN